MKGWVSVCFFLYPSRHTDMAQYGNPEVWAGCQAKSSSKMGYFWRTCLILNTVENYLRIDWVPVTYVCTYTAPLNWVSDNNYPARCSGYLFWSKPGVWVSPWLIKSWLTGSSRAVTWRQEIPPQCSGLRRRRYMTPLLDSRANLAITKWKLFKWEAAFLPGVRTFIVTWGHACYCVALAHARMLRTLRGYLAGDGERMGGWGVLGWGWWPWEIWGETCGASICLFPLPPSPCPHGWYHTTCKVQCFLL